MIVAVPAAKHVAAVVVIVGVDGTVNCAEILNEALAAEEQDPLLAVVVFCFLQTSATKIQEFCMTA